MGKRAQRSQGEQGNYVSEWFGFRVWPNVDSSESARVHQAGRLCPFLSVVLGLPTECTKAARGFDEPTGVCTISSDSNGERQDWLACPIRILDQHFTLLGTIIRRVFAIPDDIQLVLLPRIGMERLTELHDVVSGLGTTTRLFGFSASKLGGEVDIPETASSPGAKVDFSIIEITGVDEVTRKPSSFGKHMLLELQTADFHGSPLHAVKLLAEKCPRNTEDDFHAAMRAHPEDCGSKVEGPNKANIFKRMIYQMVFKMEIAERSSDCAGFAVVVPTPVWDSWLRHLGKPKFEPLSDGATKLKSEVKKESPKPSWVFVFDIDRKSSESPQPLRVLSEIVVAPDALIELAFQSAPQQAIDLGATETYRRVLTERMTHPPRGRQPSAE